MAVLMIDQMHGKHEEDIAFSARVQSRFRTMLNHVVIQLTGIIKQNIVTEITLIIVIRILMFDQMDVHFNCGVEVCST